MAHRLEWSPRAIDDLEAVAAYISKDSTAYAEAVIRTILNSARNLREFPMLGRVVPEIGEQNTREKLVYGYRLIDRIENHMITIAAVIHGRQLLEQEMLG